MTLEQIKTWFRKLKWHPYIYIDPCPECQSRRTGRYVKFHKVPGDDAYMERESLKNGEIIRFVSKVPKANVFCVDCDHTWTQEYGTTFLSAEELQNEIDERGTAGAYREIVEEQNREYKSKNIFAKRRGKK